MRFSREKSQVLRRRAQIGVTVTAGARAVVMGGTANASTRCARPAMAANLARRSTRRPAHPAFSLRNATDLAGFAGDLAYRVTTSRVVATDSVPAGGPVRRGRRAPCRTTPASVPSGIRSRSNRAEPSRSKVRRAAMSERNSWARTVHDLGLAIWMGGSLMGAVGLNAAAKQAAEPTDRIRVANAGCARWTPVNALGIVAYAPVGRG
jgi:hypothetical protein